MYELEKKEEEEEEDIIQPYIQNDKEIYQFRHGISDNNYDENIDYNQDECLLCKINFDGTNELIENDIFIHLRKTMMKGYRNGKLKIASKICAKYWNKYVVKPINKCRDQLSGCEKTITKISKIDFEKHYLENHPKSLTVSIYSDINRQEQIINDLFKFEYKYRKNDGEKDSITKKKKMKMHVNMKTAKMIFDNIAKLSNFRTKIDKRMRIADEKNDTFNQLFDDSHTIGGN